MSESIQTRRIEYNVDSFKIDVAKGYKLTTSQIVDFVQKHKGYSYKWYENESYYNGLNTYILNDRIVNSRDTSPDNRIANPKARTLTDTIAGYIYSPGYIKYNSGNETLIENVNNIFNENYENTVTYNIGLNMSKYGVAYEIIYTGFDEQNKAIPYFNIVNPKQVFFVYNYDFDMNEVCAIRYYKVNDITNNMTEKIEVYYDNEIVSYKIGENGISEVSRQPHFFGQIPVVCYFNNDELYAEYEVVKSLIDAKDMLISATLDETQKLALAYLILKGYKIDDESLESIRTRRVFENIDSEGDVKFLTKDINPQFLEFVDTKIEREIQRSTAIPDFTDESFGTSSGIAMQYKLLPFEYLARKKEANAKKGLQKRLEIIIGFLNKSKGFQGYSSEIDIIFNRNIPNNYVESVDVIAKGRGNIPLSILLQRYPDIKDVQKAIDELKTESDSVEPLSEMVEMPENNMDDELNNQSNNETDVE